MKTLCCWCDREATGKPVDGDPACPYHSQMYTEPMDMEAIVLTYRLNRDNPQN